MWVYYEEIEGRLDSKWIIVKAKPNEKYPFYSLNVPFQRFNEEDFQNNLKLFVFA